MLQSPTILAEVEVPRLPSTFLYPLTVAGWALSAMTQAGLDARRAWVMSPIRFGWSVYDRHAGGGWRLRHRRRFRRREVLRLKLLSAGDVFVRSLRVGLAGTVRIPHLPTEGLLANLLHVIEVLHRVRPDARVHVNWVLTGDERGFRYGKVGDDIWALLFLPIGRGSTATAYRAASAIDFAFWGTGKDHLTGRSLKRHRRAYHSTVSRWLQVSNEQVNEHVRQICRQFPAGCLRIGVHRRVGNARVADLQQDGRIPSPQDFIVAVRLALEKEGATDFIVFLGTDDADAVTVFRDTFGARLVLQEHVQRTTADLVEVHFRGWGQVSITDAIDVLADAIVLSRCDVLIHASSSVSTFAAIANPDLALVRVSTRNPASSVTGYARVTSTSGQQQGANFFRDDA